MRARASAERRPSTNSWRTSSVTQLVPGPSCERSSCPNFSSLGCVPMKTPPPLAHEFRSHLSTRVSIPEDQRELEDLLRRAFEKAAAEWPAVQLSPEAFIRHLARRIPKKYAGEPLGDVLEELSLGELYLACACALGDKHAILEFESNYLRALPEKLKTLKLSADELSDSLQALRETMLVRKGERELRIG